MSTGSHRLKKPRGYVKLHGVKFPFNEGLQQEDTASQREIAPIHNLSRAQAQKRTATSHYLVAQELSSSVDGLHIRIYSYSIIFQNYLFMREGYFERRINPIKKAHTWLIERFTMMRIPTTKQTGWMKRIL
jgi:hypothetical protein